jgi:hypothetical protein
MQTMVDTNKVVDENSGSSGPGTLGLLSSMILSDCTITMQLQAGLEVAWPLRL